jgi:small subunit ribosomal protein S17
MSEIVEDKIKGAVVGIVTSNKMEKTIVVEVKEKRKHPQYKKYITYTHKGMKAHDPDNLCEIGDKVMIKPCRPLSKTKTWELVKIVEKTKLPVID